MTINRTFARHYAEMVVVMLIRMGVTMTPLLMTLEHVAMLRAMFACWPPGRRSTQSPTSRR